MSIELGSFTEAEYGKCFWYSKSENEWGLENGLPHEIETRDGHRCALIKKTVAYIAVDEDEYGKPVLEKWNIKRHQEFTRAHD